MPTWVKSIVKSDNKDLLKKLEDFNQIIPMPEPLQKFDEGFQRFWSLSNFIDFVKAKDVQINLDTLKELAQDFSTLNNKPEAMEDEYILQANTYFLTGYTTPNDWAVANWDTKWNACDFKTTDDGCEFETAWNHPYPVIQELSKMFPDETIEVLYASEDIGCNLGHYTIKNGCKTLLVDDNITHKEKYWFGLCVQGWQDDYKWNEHLHRYVSRATGL